MEVNLLDKYPQTKRPLNERAIKVNEEIRVIARKFDMEYFDGDRFSGYGGYNYHPKFWTDTVIRFRDYYKFKKGTRILDIGCAKGFFLYDVMRIIPDIHIVGLDISQYALKNAHDISKPYLILGDAKELPFSDKSFDLVISINTIHNLPIDECKQALREITRVSKGNSFVTMDAWRNNDEMDRMLKWNLTAKTYMHVDDWKKLFDEVGYTGDYYWFIAE